MRIRHPFQLGRFGAGWLDGVLAGLVQAGGPWQPDLRRGDGLPWLGTLEEPFGLAPALALRLELLLSR